MSSTGKIYGKGIDLYGFKSAGGGGALSKIPINTQELNDLIEANTYDYIIVGAGSAGCVLASRLSTDYLGDTKPTILILEAGPDTSRSNVDTNTYMQALQDTPAFFQFLYSKFLPDANNPGKFMSPNGLMQLANQKDNYDSFVGEFSRRIFYPRGSGSGGSTNHHALIHGRGSANPYDNWAFELNETVRNTWLEEDTLLWSHKDVSPFFKVQEKYYPSGDAPGYVTPTYPAWSPSINYLYDTDTLCKNNIVTHNGKVYISRIKSGPSVGGNKEPGVTFSEPYWEEYETDVHLTENYQSQWLNVRKMVKLRPDNYIEVAPVWSGAYTFHLGDIVRSPTNSSLYYTSVTNFNVNNPLTNPTFWTRYEYTPTQFNLNSLNTNVIRGIQAIIGEDSPNARFNEDPSNKAEILGFHLTETDVKMYPTGNGKYSGVRSNSYEDLLHNVLQTNGNVTIKYNTTVERLLFDDNNNCVGVICMEAPYHQLHAEGGDIVRDLSLQYDYPQGSIHGIVNRNKNTPVETIFYHKKETILCAGAQITPQILLLSGVGNPEFLELENIPVKIASNNVGAYLLDHLEGSMTFNLDPTKICWKWQAAFLKTLNKAYYNGLTDLTAPSTCSNVALSRLSSYAALGTESDPILNVVYGSGSISAITATGSSFTLNNITVNNNGVILLTGETDLIFNGLYLVTIVGANVTLTNIDGAKTMYFVNAIGSPTINTRVFRRNDDKSMTELTAAPNTMIKRSIEDHMIFYKSIKNTIDNQFSRVNDPIIDLFQVEWEPNKSYGPYEIVKFNLVYFRSTNVLPNLNRIPTANPTYWTAYSLTKSPVVTYFKNNFLQDYQGQKYIMIGNDPITGNSTFNNKNWKIYAPGDIFNSLGTNAIPLMWDPALFTNVNKLDGNLKQNTNHMHVAEALFIDFNLNWHGSKEYNSVIPGLLQPDQHEPQLQDRCFILPNNSDSIAPKWNAEKQYLPNDLVSYGSLLNVFRCKTAIQGGSNPTINTTYWEDSLDFRWNDEREFQENEFIRYQYNESELDLLTPTFYELGFTIFRVKPGNTLFASENPTQNLAKVDVIGVKDSEQTALEYDNNWKAGNGNVLNNKFFRVFSQLYPQNNGSYEPGVYMTFLNENIIYENNDFWGYIQTQSPDIRTPPLMYLNLTQNEKILDAFTYCWLKVRQMVYEGTTLSNGDHGVRDYSSCVDPNKFAYYLKPSTFNSPDNNFPNSAEIYPGEDKNTMARLKDYIKKWTNYGHHISGTCQMGKTIEEGVVDSRCRVFGTKNLRICDTSIANRTWYHAYNTSAFAYVVAERLADLMIYDL